MAALVKEAMLKILGNDEDAVAKLDAITAQADAMRDEFPELVARIDTAEATAKMQVLRDELKQTAASADDLTVATGEYADAQEKAAAASARLAGVQADDKASAEELSAAMDDMSAATIRALDAQMRLVGAEERAAFAAAEAGDAMKASGDEMLVAGRKADETGDEVGGGGMLSKLRLGSMALLGVAAGVGFVGYESVKMAATFQRSMEMLVTQAGVPKGSLAALKTGVLDLAGQVGFGPNSLAQALYHIESSFQSVGITGPKAMSLLRIASEGAQVGGSDLVDTTNALDAVIVAGVPGIHSYSQAMGALNDIVGAGDMTMQDLANALGTGVMAIAKNYGQSIYQVGAALAVFGDNNIRGAKAATDLRMAWQAVQSPLVAGIAVLNKLGLSQYQLASTMEHHGLSAALLQFRQHLEASKVPMSDWGQLETEIFGKRAGTGLSILVAQYDRLMSKFPDLEKGAKDFGSAWQDTQKTVGVEWDKLKSLAGALAITIGDKVLPPAEAFLGLLSRHEGVFLGIAGGVGVLVAALALFTVAEKLATGASEMFDLSLDANPIGLIVVAVAALAIGMYELYKHSRMVRDAVADVAHFFAGAWRDAMHLAGDAIKWFDDGPLKFIHQEIGQFTAWWKQNHVEIEKIAKVVWAFISDYVRVEWDIIKTVVTTGLAALKVIWDVTWDVFKTTVKVAWDVMAVVVRTAITDIEDVISIVLDIIQGKWSAAWSTLKSLASVQLHAAIQVIKTVVSGFGTLLWNAGKALIQGLIGGIESMAGGLLGTISHLAGDISGAFGSVLKIFSPSKVFRLHGQNIVRGLVLGISDEGPSAVMAMRRLAGQMQSAAGGGYGGAGAGGAAGAVEVVLKVEGSGSGLDQLFMTWLKNQIRNSGGNPLVLSHKVVLA